MTIFLMEEDDIRLPEVMEIDKMTTIIVDFYLLSAMFFWNPRVRLKFTLDKRE